MKEKACFSGQQRISRADNEERILAAMHRCCDGRGTVLSCPLVSRRWSIPAFPLDVSQLKQSNVIFKAKAIEFVERHVARHGFPKVFGSLAKAFELRYVHGLLSQGLFCTKLPCDINMICKGFLYEFADRDSPRSHLETLGERLWRRPPPRGVSS
jgi:hypothetical protein